MCAGASGSQKIRSPLELEFEVVVSCTTRCQEVHLAPGEEQLAFLTVAPSLQSHVFSLSLKDMCLLSPEEGNRHRGPINSLSEP